MSLLPYPNWHIVDLLPDAFGLSGRSVGVAEPAILSLLILATGSVVGLGGEKGTSLILAGLMGNVSLPSRYDPP
jgi:hypothetical protein